MIGKYPVITGCGSTRFKDQFLEIQKQLTLDGIIATNAGLRVADAVSVAMGSLKQELLMEGDVEAPRGLLSRVIRYNPDDFSSI